MPTIMPPEDASHQANQAALGLVQVEGVTKRFRQGSAAVEALHGFTFFSTQRRKGVKGAKNLESWGDATCGDDFFQRKERRGRGGAKNLELGRCRLKGRVY